MLPGIGQKTIKVNSIDFRNIYSFGWLGFFFFFKIFPHYLEHRQDRPRFFGIALLIASLYRSLSLI